MSLWMYLVLFVYVLACFFLIFVILVQSGKGGGLSSLAGASSGLQEALGSTAGERTLNRLTYVAAGAFVVLAVILSLGATHSMRGSNQLLGDTTPAPASAPLTAGVGDLGDEMPTLPAPAEAAPADAAPAAIPAEAAAPTAETIQTAPADLQEVPKAPENQITAPEVAPVPAQ